MLNAGRGHHVFFTNYFTKIRGNCCKCLIEHSKLYLFFTIFKISGGKVLRDCPLIQAFSPEGEKVSVTRAMTAREDARPTEKLYHFLYQ